MAAHINDLEDKVGIDSDTNPNSLDYKVRNLPTQESSMDLGNNPIENVTNPTNNQDAATKKYVDDSISAIPAPDLSSVWPVGSVYINATNNANPATILGFGTWAAFGAGRVLVGYDSGDTDFNAAEKTGGSKTVDISHTHTAGAHTHTFSGTTGTYNTSFSVPSGSYYGLVNAHSHSFSGTTDSGGGVATSGMSANSTPSIVQPYITVYIWKRTA